MDPGTSAVPPDSTASPSEDAATSADLPGKHLYRLRAIIAAALALVLCSVALAFLPALFGPGGTPPGPENSASAATAPSPVPSVTAPAAAPPVTVPLLPAGPAAARPQRLIYPAASIDVVVNPLAPSLDDKARQTIIPPPTTDGYWLSPYGMPGTGSSNTTYIVGHSWQDRDAPFNRLSTKAAAGDSLTVATATGELPYVVDSVTTYVKSGLKDSPIWEVAPNRVVLISCYTDDLWGTNVVVVASPAPG